MRQTSGSGVLETVLDRVEKIAGTISEGAAESERLGRLAPAVVDALHETGLFRALVPTEFGGHGLTIPEAVEVIERVAALDASIAWTLAILADAPLFVRFLAPDASGMSAVATDSVLDRCWRDVHTMTQHIILSPARFEIAGRVVLGLDPASPVI